MMHGRLATDMTMMEERQMIMMRMMFRSRMMHGGWPLTAKQSKFPNAQTTKNTQTTRSKQTKKNNRQGKLHIQRKTQKGRHRNA